MQKTKGITNTPVFGIHKRTEQKQMLLPCAVMIFFHRAYTVGFGISPNPDLNLCQVLRIAALADYTADREFHPALKILPYVVDAFIIDPS